MKKLSLLLSSLMLLSAPALAKESASKPPAKKDQSTEPVRMIHPNTFSFGAGWPSLIGLKYQRQLTSRLAAGTELSFNLAPSLGLFGRWYLSDDPDSWYVEGLGLCSIFGAYSINALGGWESRTPDGWTYHLAGGLGVSPNMFPGTIMGLVNVDAGIGYSF